MAGRLLGRAEHLPLAGTTSSSSSAMPTATTRRRPAPSPPAPSSSTCRRNSPATTRACISTGCPISTVGAAGRFRRRHARRARPEDRQELDHAPLRVLGAGRNNPPDSSIGAEPVRRDRPYPRALDHQLSVVGRVVKGMELLSTIPRGPTRWALRETGARAPIVSTAGQRRRRRSAPRCSCCAPTAAFIDATEARRNRVDDFYTVPAGPHRPSNGLAGAHAAGEVGHIDEEKAATAAFFLASTIAAASELLAGSVKSACAAGRTRCRTSCPQVSAAHSENRASCPRVLKVHSSGTRRSTSCPSSSRRTGRSGVGAQFAETSAPARRAGRWCGRSGAPPTPASRPAAMEVEGVACVEAALELGDRQVVPLVASGPTHVAVRVHGACRAAGLGCRPASASRSSSRSAWRHQAKPPLICRL